MSFEVQGFFNPHLAVGARRTDAVLTITCNTESAPSAEVAVAFIVDVSGSMGENGKMDYTKLALRHTLDQLPESIQFCIVTFHSDARVVVPMTRATRQAIAAAHKAVQGLVPSGSTAMSNALEAVHAEFEKVGRDAIKISKMLTDGKNDTDDKSDLNRALKACQGFFQCDTRGIGADWRPDDLRHIASTLLGTADAVGQGDALAQDFKQTLDSAVSKGVSNAVLRLWAPATATILSVKQVMPAIEDLTKAGRQFDPKTLDFPLGAWGSESRDYHVSIELPEGAAGTEMLACRPSVVFKQDGNETKVAGPNIVAVWSADDALTTRINSQVAHYTGQAELAESIQEGLEAKARGDIDQATRLLGKAVKIAAETGNDEVTRRLHQVVDVENVQQGTVRIKRTINKEADLALEMGGTRTVRRRTVTSGTSA